MKIEKITENKIRIIVDLQELKTKNIKLNDFMINNIESQKFFLEILNRAEKEIGFKTNNCKLLIESFSSLDDFFVFTITKFSKNNKNKSNLKFRTNKKTTLLKNPIYKFTSFEEFCLLCLALNKHNITLNNIAKKISLYLYNNTYYLVFHNLNLTNKDLKQILLIISEFSLIIKDNNFDAKLLEYGKPIIKQNAFKTGIKYFI